MRKWNLPLTYAPKIQGVINGTIRQTIRPGRKFATDDLVAFHGWEGKPYRSKWSFRTPYYKLLCVFPAVIYPNGMEIDFFGWGCDDIFPWDCLDNVARADGIDPPTGEGLRDVFSSMYRIPDTGKEAQIIRWGVPNVAKIEVVP